MKVYQTNEIKNIALLGSSGSGKTTLVEAMLFESGVIKRRGSVAAKNTVSDYFPVEQEYGYSVFSTVLHVEWNNKKLNIIDCPGSDDFVGSTVTALNVTDTAIILLNGQYGYSVPSAFQKQKEQRYPRIPSSGERPYPYLHKRKIRGTYLWRSIPYGYLRAFHLL